MEHTWSVIIINNPDCQTLFVKFFIPTAIGFVVAVPHPLSGIEVCIVNYFYIKTFWVLAQNLIHWAITALSGMWNWLRHELGLFFFFFCWKEEAGSEWSAEWWACWLECFWKSLSFHLCCAQRHKIIQRLPAAQNLFVPRAREALFVHKEGTNVRFPSFSFPFSLLFLTTAD